MSNGLPLYGPNDGVVIGAAVVAVVVAVVVLVNEQEGTVATALLGDVDEGKTKGGEVEVVALVDAVVVHRRLT